MKKKFKLFEDLGFDSDSDEVVMIPNVPTEKPYVTNISIADEDQILATPKKGKTKGVIKPGKVTTKFDIPKRDKKKKFIQDQDLTPDESQQGQPIPNQMAGDQALGGMGIPGMDMGMGSEYDVNMPKTDEQIGRIFELKKIYQRLLSLDTYLSFSSDPVLIKLRIFTSDAVELFEVLISNIMKFQDKIDDIIVIYYKFLNLIYNVIKAYYKSKDEREKNDELNTLEKGE